MKNGTRLLVHKSVDNKGQVPLIPHRRHTRQSKKKEGVDKARSKVEI